MASDFHILLPRPTKWRIGVIRAKGPSWIDVPIAPDAPPEKIASAVAAALKGAGYSGEGAVLAIPSAWCLSAPIAIGDLPKNDRKAMLFRLEEKLPVAAESLVADFLTDERARSRSPIFVATALADGTIRIEQMHGVSSAKSEPVQLEHGHLVASAGHASPEQRALGICVRTADLRPILEALESAGVAIQSITPAMLLSLQGLLTPANHEARIALLGEPSDAPEPQVNLFDVEGGRPRAWELLPARTTDLTLSLQLIALEREGLPPLAAWNVDSRTLDAISEATGSHVATDKGNVDEAAARTAAKILSGRQRPWVEFRRGALGIADPIATHRKPLNLLLASVAALALACAGAMFVRAALYDRLANSHDQQMQRAFQAQFPGRATPVNVRAMVASEHRLAAGNVGAALPMESNRSALQTLHDVLDKLPAAGEFTIDRMTLEDAAFEIQGRLRSYEEIDAIASAARKAGMQTPPPQRHKDADGFWSFTLRGELPAKAPAEVAKGGAP